MTLLKILFIIVGFLLLISLWGFYISVRPSKIISTITPKELGFTYEQVIFKTKDGLNLSGWFVPNELSTKGGSSPDGRSGVSGGKAKTIVLLHGYPADKGDILPVLAFLREQYNLFLFDFRYFGQSEGQYSTAGAKETEDLRAAINFLKSRGVSEVGVLGFSMGGAVALMTAPKAPEIKAIVALSSYASLDRMALELYRIPVLKYPLAYLIGLWAKIFLGIDLKKVSPAESARTLTIPILVVHSKNDEVIPFKNALLIQELLKNNPKTEFWFQEDLIHGQFDGTHQKKIGDFFKKNL
ncbi:MAG: alpha/beta fold hydrolase [Patescibacteria group bacterium]|nr:alpha/beta fold hydrolase [Patescibacteria group bacterium]